MKKLLIIILFCAAIIPEGLYAQANNDKLDLPGDNLNLYAVLKLFQESETLEGFEKSLNDEKNEINNLDLNGDDKTDYIKVIDNTDGDVHTIVLQTDVSADEKQDIAVFTVQKDKDGKVQIQLIGDEELYGKDYIIEPNAEDNVDTAGTPNPGYTGNKTEVQGQEITVEKTTTVIVAGWPVIRYIYLPGYIIWHSPWYWNYYPAYWNPWRPLYWHAYWGYHSNLNYWYYGHYRRWQFYRYSGWNDFYFNKRRAHSVIVYQRREKGLYRNTYSKPETRKDGIALYNKMNPGGNRLPVKPEKQKPVTRPVTKPITKPAYPGTRPVVEKPATKPDRPVVRPVTKPTRPAIQKPVMKPIHQNIPKPGVKPSIISKDKKGGSL